MKKIAIVTATRAEYGLLLPLIKKVLSEDGFELALIVSGTHLSEKHGHTIDEIRRDGIPIAHEISIINEDNDSYGISITMANALKGFADYFRADRPDMVVILGDRTEMLGVAAAAMNERIPISHLNGGEVTAGAVDDCVRHALTKMSYLHFAATETYRKRIIQMGEDPRRVYNVGALCAENVRCLELIQEDDIRSDIGIPVGQQYAVVTFHPVTVEDNTVETQINELICAMDGRTSLFYVITSSNADVGGDIANRMLSEYGATRPNAIYVRNLGMKRYLSALTYASFVLGNSSSGLSEAPIIGTPTVNIGDRQKGRLIAETVVCCEPERNAIENAIDMCLAMDHTPTKIFGDGYTSDKIVAAIKDNLEKGIDLKKGFYDIDNKMI